MLLSSHGFVALSIPRAAGTHQRSWIWPQGNRGFTSVAIGNELAWKTCLILIFASSRGLRWLLEQPEGSAAPIHPGFQWLFDTIQVGTVCGLWTATLFQRCVQVWSTGVWHGLYWWFIGTPKRQRWFSNDSQMLQSLSAVAGKMQPGDRARFGGESLTKRYRKADGSIGWSGKTSVLKSSQSLCCLKAVLLVLRFGVLCLFLAPGSALCPAYW